MIEESPLIDRFVMGVDMQKYSRLNTRRQADSQREMARMLDESAAEMALDRGQWDCQPGGDGEVAVLPPDTDLVKVVGPFVSVLADKLRVYNEDRVPDIKIRLRLAMHIDALKRSTFRYAGPALVVVSRLLDSRPVRDALVWAEDADLALIVSQPVYQKVVLSGLSSIRADQFRAVRVDLPSKGFSTMAYLHVPGTDMNVFGLEQETPRKGKAPADADERGLAATGGAAPGSPRNFAVPTGTAAEDRGECSPTVSPRAAEQGASPANGIQIADTINNTSIDRSTFNGGFRIGC